MNNAHFWRCCYGRHRSWPLRRLAQPAAPPPAPQPQVQIMRVEREPMRVHTRDDVVKHVRDLFARLDTNRDGFITREEAGIAKLAMGGESA